MRKIIAAIVFAFVLVACNPVDYIAETAKDECQELLDEELPKIEEQVWGMCIGFYEDVVIPGLRYELSNIIDDLYDRIEDMLVDAEAEVMARFGCIPLDSPPGWDCTETTICQ